MKKFLSLFCVGMLSAMVSIPGNAVVKSGRCDIHRANKASIANVLGSAIGGGIGWATGTAVGASLAPFGLIGRGGVDPVVGTIRINGAILAGGVAGAIGGSSLGRGLASKIYAADDYLCFDNDINKCLQCDWHQIGDAYECGDEHVVIGPDFQFVKRCNASRIMKDRWEDFRIPKCGSSKEITAGRSKVDIISSYVHDLSGDGAPGWLVVKRDVCVKLDCEDGWNYDSGTKECKEAVAPTPEPEPEPEKKSCRERRVNMGTEAIACCDTGKAADWKSVSGEYKCVCKNQKTEFKIVNGRGQCVPKQVDPVVEPDKPVPPVTKDCPVDAYPSDDNKTCICNDNNMTYNAGKNSCECPSGSGAIKTGGVCKCPDPNKELVNGKCEYGDAHWSVQIDGYYSQLHGIIDGLKLNVWRDAEGNFNTARLASDSIAGVVLGTVGGVVTAHLVKKNQLKKGFEDIQCHIGGQSVADYGDGFVVGR